MDDDRHADVVLPLAVRSLLTVVPFDAQIATGYMDANTLAYVAGESTSSHVRIISSGSLGAFACVVFGTI